MKYRTEITIHTRRRIVLRSRRTTIPCWCALCEADSAMLSPNEAAVFFKTTAREIFRLTEAGEIHFRETETGALLVCRRSIEAISEFKKK